MPALISFSFPALSLVDAYSFFKNPDIGCLLFNPLDLQGKKKGCSVRRIVPTLI